MSIIQGNINDQASLHRGWILGHFMDSGSPFKTNNIEVKWGVHSAGEHKEVFAKNETAKTLSILIRGKFTLVFDNKRITLEKEGDYCFWESGVSHSWLVDEDCLIITVRWPSLPADQTPVV